MKRKDRAPAAPYDGPQSAYLKLADGSTITCAIFEDPQRDQNGMRVFLLQPVRQPAANERVVGAWFDRLPPKSVATIDWYGKPLPAGSSVSMSWQDPDGIKHAREQDLPGTLDAGGS